MSFKTTSASLKRFGSDKTKLSSKPTKKDSSLSSGSGSESSTSSSRRLLHQNTTPAMSELPRNLHNNNTLTTLNSDALGCSTILAVTDTPACTIVFSGPSEDYPPADLIIPGVEPLKLPGFPAVQPRLTKNDSTNLMEEQRKVDRSAANADGANTYLSPLHDGGPSWRRGEAREAGEGGPGSAPATSRRSLCQRPTADETKMKRSSSTRSRLGGGAAEHHMGSSVTFCNQTSLTSGDFPTLHPLNHDNGILRRSCSLTLVSPHGSRFPHNDGDSANIDRAGASVRDRIQHKSMSLRPRSPRAAALDFSPGLLLLPPPVTYDRVSTAPTTPTWGQRSEGMRGSGSQMGFGSAYQLHARSKTMISTSRGSFLAINQSPMEFRDSTQSINYPNCADDSDDVSLVYTRLEKIPMKDFAAEIRAHLDVEQFLSQAQLMLDVQETEMDRILDKMLHHLLDKEESTSAFQDATKALFTDNSAQHLSKTLQCTCCTYDGDFDFDQSWICVLCTVASVQKRHVAIARLRNPANLGRTSQEVWFVILVVTSIKEKGTKNALETGRTFSTLFADMDLRIRLLAARTENEFKQFMWVHMKELAEEQCNEHSKRTMSDASELKLDDIPTNMQNDSCWFARGLRADAKRRIPYYASDFKDGFCGPNTLHKTISTTFFLYFACILPAIALGVLNYSNTGGKIDVRKAIYSQTIGGLIFAIFGGQPMVILLTTAPLALFTKVISNICDDWGLDFYAMYACSGLWNSLFLLIYAFTDASKLMKWCTRSTEEIFALFISVAFTVDAFKDAVYDFKENYHSPKCDVVTNTTLARSQLYGAEEVRAMALQGTDAAGNGALSPDGSAGDCLRENSLLYLLLMLGTVWLGLSLYNFTKTPFLNASKRELLADCALPVSVIVMSFFGSYVFRDVNLKKFRVIDGNIFNNPQLQTLGLPQIIGAMGLGFCLSILFFMDQNIAAVMVNSPDNRMKKGSAYHWDLMIVAIINAVLVIFGLPMVHGALPHSPLHVRAMADKEDRVYQGHVYLKIVSVRETRVTGILSHILIGLSVQFIHTLQLIPRPVLDGLFLYLAITALHSNQLFERIMLLVTEQAAYPPNHYIRTVPQRKIHLFTFIQLLQLAMLCGFGFAPVPYLKIVFPVLHFVMLPIRHKLVPRLVERKYLHSLDGH